MSPDFGVLCYTVLYHIILHHIIIIYHGILYWSNIWGLYFLDPPGRAAQGWILGTAL